MANEHKILNGALYAGIFGITQITGLMLSLAICFVLADFIWGFMRMAMVNSFILGVALVSCSFITRNLMFRIHTLIVLFISFSVILGTAIISFVILLINEPTLFIYYNRGASAFLFINLLFIIAFYVISSGLIVYREIMAKKEEAIHQERVMKNEMEMKLLSSKVNPHFLFNTLNMILNLLKKPELAETALLNLSDLLRNNLDYSDQERISIHEELENVRKYLEIQKLRFGDKLEFSIEGNIHGSIPPLIIQPLVENSIKHNIQNVEFLSVEVMISESEKGFTVIVKDSKQKVNESMLHKGKGLTITQKRVQNSGGTFTIINGTVEIHFE